MKGYRFKTCYTETWDLPCKHNQDSQGREQAQEDEEEEEKEEKDEDKTNFLRQYVKKMQSCKFGVVFQDNKLRID